MKIAGVTGAISQWTIPILMSILLAVFPTTFSTSLIKRHNLMVCEASVSQFLTESKLLNDRKAKEICKKSRMGDYTYAELIWLFWACIFLWIGTVLQKTSGRKA